MTDVYLTIIIKWIFFLFKVTEILTFHQSSLESSRRVIMSPGLKQRMDELDREVEAGGKK
jgi:hypothetical protein